MSKTIIAIAAAYATASAESDKALFAKLSELRDAVHAARMPESDLRAILRAELAPRYLLAVAADGESFARREGCDMPVTSYKRLKDSARTALSRATRYVYEESPKAEREEKEAPASVKLTERQEQAFMAAWESLGYCDKKDFKAALVGFLAGYEG